MFWFNVFMLAMSMSLLMLLLLLVTWVVDCIREMISSCRRNPPNRIEPYVGEMPFIPPQGEREPVKFTAEGGWRYTNMEN